MHFPNSSPCEILTTRRFGGSRRPTSTFIPTTAPNRVDADRAGGESHEVSGLEPTQQTGQEELHDLEGTSRSSAS